MVSKKMILVAMFIVGLAVAVVRAVDCYEEVDPYYLKFDVPSMIHIHSVSDVAKVRQQMKDIIWWKKGSYPADKMPASVLPVDPIPEWITQIGSNNIARVERLDIVMDYDLHSYSYLIHPKISGKGLLIYHQGHADSILPYGGQGTIKFFLDRGFAVMTFYMPLKGENPLVATNVPGKGTVTFVKNNAATEHDLLVTMEESVGGNGLRFFWEPIIVGINYCQSKYKFKDIVAAGCSGGGQSTHFAAALDTRIRLSFPCSGGLPNYLREGPCGGARFKGDLECYYPPLFDKVNFLDVYILGASGKGRGQVHILNKYDDCCWWGVGYKTFETYVKKIVEAVGEGGFYRVFCDDSHREHTISSYAHYKAICPLLFPDERCDEEANNILAQIKNPNIKVAQVKVYAKTGDMEGNYKLLLDVLGQIEKADKVDVVVVPEDFLDGCSVINDNIGREDLAKAAIDAQTSPYIKGLEEWANRNQAWVIFGFVRKDANDIRPSAAIINRQGKLVDCYDKTHLTGVDLKYGCKGGKRLDVYDSDFGKFGVMICADRQWPQTSRTLTIKGAKVIFNPTYGMSNDINLAMMRTRAYENGIYICFTHPRQSLITGPGGEVITNNEDTAKTFTITQIDVSKASGNKTDKIIYQRNDIYVNQ